MDEASAEPASPAARALASRLIALDDAAWNALLPMLRRIAGRLAPQFADVASPDDVLGELALRSHERWLREWAEGVNAGTMRRSLQVFLRDRLRDHLREMRRTHQRRRALLGLSTDGPAVETGLDDPPVAAAIFASAPPSPDDDLSARELRALGGSLDPEARAILALREAGFSQEEIANMLRTSRPTVTRRLAVVSAVIAAAVLALVLAFVAGRHGDPAPAPPVALRPESERAAVRPEPPPAPAEEAPEPRPGQIAPPPEPQEAPREPAIRPRRLELDASVPAREPRDAADAARDARVRECLIRGDNACVVELLEGHARTEWQLSTLIEAYRTRGQTNEALSHMRTYVERFPGTARARQYSQILARAPAP